jgi:hypothetical protein
MLLKQRRPKPNQTLGRFGFQDATNVVLVISSHDASVHIHNSFAA